MKIKSRKSHICKCIRQKLMTYLFRGGVVGGVKNTPPPLQIRVSTPYTDSTILSTCD